jgi:hypothetical protein
MPKPIPNKFADYHVTLELPASARLTGAQKTAIKTAAAARGTVSLQQHCAVAEAANEAFGGIYDNRRNNFDDLEILDFGELGTYTLNRFARARFGVHQNGEIFLTIGIKQADGNERYRLTWKAAHIPETLAMVAAAHDKGDQYPAASIELSLGQAELRSTPTTVDRRKNTAARKASKNGKPRANGTPRRHQRVCVADIERTYKHTYTNPN